MTDINHRLANRQCMSGSTVYFACTWSHGIAGVDQTQRK